MARPLRIQYPGAYYHVTCRGNEKKTIFLANRDREVFFEKLILSLDTYHVYLLAYVCMPNHFHFLLTTPEGNLAEFMRHFNVSYTSVFNRRHERVGHLYQGRYKAFLIDADSYLLELSRYIHLNPVRGKAFSDKSEKEKWDVIRNFKNSSLPGYFSVKKRDGFVDYSTVLAYMGGDDRKGRARYRQFVRGGISGYLESPLELGKGHGIVGDSDFVDQIKREFVVEAGTQREQPALRELGKAYAPEKLIEHFLRLTGKERIEICRRGKSSIERAMLMEFLYRFCRLTQPQIGRLFGGIDYSGVSQARKRLHAKLKKDPQTERTFEKLKDQLNNLS
jgi:REP element-mobilizing transposase RayT